VLEKRAHFGTISREGLAATDDELVLLVQNPKSLGRLTSFFTVSDSVRWSFRHRFHQRRPSALRRVKDAGEGLVGLLACEVKNWSSTVKHDKLNFDSPQGLVMVGGNIQSISTPIKFNDLNVIPSGKLT